LQRRLTALVSWISLPLPRKQKAAPFLRDPIGEGAILVRLAFHRERVLRDRQDPLFRHDEFLYERYRFSRQGIINLQDLLESFIAPPQSNIDCTTTVEHCLSCPFLPVVAFCCVRD